jgi:hypothetical protein
MEEFREVKGYEGLYEVSSLGRIKSLKTRKLLSLNPNKRDGYVNITLVKNGVNKSFRAHQLVAIAFLKHEPDNTNKLVVDHKNNIKHDNRLVNLNIITNRENCSKEVKGKSNLLGATWCNTYSKWKSQIRHKGKRIYVGSFNTDVEAHHAYKNKLNELLNEV